MTTPKEFNEELCRALGLEPRDVAALRIDLLPNSWPRLTVTKLLRDVAPQQAFAASLADADCELKLVEVPQLRETFELQPKD